MKRQPAIFFYETSFTTGDAEEAIQASGVAEDPESRLRCWLEGVMSGNGGRGQAPRFAGLFRPFDGEIGHNGRPVYRGLKVL